jgi:hypothetical protein
LRVEEFDDAFAFADDLGRHSAATAAAETAAATAAEATASAAVAAALLKSALVSKTWFFEEPVALVPAATATIAFAPSVETHSV